MSAPRVLIRDSATEPDLRSAPVRLGGAWGLLVPVGLVFTLVGGADLALVWYPLGFGSAEWEFGSATSMLNGLPVLVMGLAFLGMAAVASGRRWAGRGIGALLLLLAVAVVLVGALYATTIPIALKAAPNAMVALGIKKAIAKTTIQAAVYPVLLTWLGIATWRRASQQV